ncbi:MAG: hypothetical protein ACTTHI_07795 [Prevotella sp.]
MRKKRKPNNWFLKRSEILAKYAGKYPVEYDKIEMKFSFPTYGWMPFQIIKNKEVVKLRELSYACDAFVPMREWLEGIVEGHYDKISVIKLDCEDFYTVLYFEPLWFFDSFYEGIEVKPSDAGIFLVYDSFLNAFVVDAFCNIESLVKSLYYNLLEFADKMKENPKFTEEWVSVSWNEEWGELEDDDPKIHEIFFYKMKSPIIEKYLEDCQRNGKM